MAIRANGRVEGLWLPGSGGEQVKVAMYADDMTLFAIRERSVAMAMEVRRFEAASGLAINIQKSQVKYFSNWSSRKQQVCGMQVCEGPLRVLGVDFVEGDSSHLNWERKIAGARKRLGLWQQRPLTITGKVMVLKADILSSLIYLLCLSLASKAACGPDKGRVQVYLGGVRVRAEGPHVPGGGRGWA